MLEKLIELMVQGWRFITPICEVDVHETGAILRCGKWGRAVVAGWHWKWPVLEKLIVVESCITTLRLPHQTLTTKDDVGVVVAGIIKYQIVDVKPYVTEIWDQNDVLADVTMGAIRRVILGKTYADLVTINPEDDVLSAVRKEVNRYGFKVHRVTFVDLARVRSIRLIQEPPKNIDN